MLLHSALSGVDAHRERWLKWSKRTTSNIRFEGKNLPWVSNPPISVSIVPEMA